MVRAMFLFLFFSLMTGTGSSLSAAMVKAIPQAVIHHRAFSAFTASLSPDYDQELKDWSDMVVKWEMDKTQACPYDLPEEGRIPLFTLIRLIE